MPCKPKHLDVYTYKSNGLRHVMLIVQPDDADAANYCKPFGRDSQRRCGHPGFMDMREGGVHGMKKIGEYLDDKKGNFLFNLGEMLDEVGERLYD